ncbi:hypothetical protein ACJZ2D_016514 [Fusarium nematophilum]
MSSVSTFISTFRTLLNSVEKLKPKVENIRPDDDQWVKLEELSTSFKEAASILHEEIRTQRKKRNQRAWEESGKLRTQANEAKGYVLANGRLRQPPAFRTNICIIFRGPKPSAFDTDERKSKKDLTGKRCEEIRQLSPDGIISWAISFPSSTWAGGAMSFDIFTALLDSIEPNLHMHWPPVVRQTLRDLPKDETDLETCPEYQEFLAALDGSSQAPTRKRKRLDQDENGLGPKDTSPGFEYRFTGLISNHLDFVCGPYLAAGHKKSTLWEESITHGFGVAFPSDPEEDAFVLISMSQASATDLFRFMSPILPTPLSHEQYTHGAH